MTLMLDGRRFTELTSLLSIREQAGEIWRREHRHRRIEKEIAAMVIHWTVEEAKRLNHKTQPLAPSSEQVFFRLSHRRLHLHLLLTA